MADPPSADEIEISIFGPGKGESVVLHLGSGDWIIVDSCIDSRDKSIPALAYLDRIGVDATSQVKLIVATHAHDDHIAGISRIVESCKSAEFVASQAIESTEFFTLLEEDELLERSFGVRKGILTEYRRVMDIISERENSSGVIPFKRAVQELPLLTTTSGSRVTALSPSHQAVSRSLRTIAQTMKSAGETPRLAFIDPNELAVALWVEAMGHSFLLGADLLAGPAGCGWTAILDFFEPSVRAALFKVPHHGAPNADHDGIWSDLVAREPICLMTPYRAGVTPRPNLDDQGRISARTPNAFITADPDSIAPSRAVRRLAKSLGPLPKNVRDPWGIPGQVRARLRAGTPDWDVQLVHPARRISS